MNKNFDKYIKDNINLFDDLTPPMELWENIDKKIPHKKQITLKKIILGSASIAAIFIIALIAIKFTDRTSNSNSKLYTEIKETERYYNNILNSKKDEVYKLTSHKPEIKQGIDNELALLDSAMLELKNDLKDDISNTEVIEAMIQNYRMKLKILEDMMKYLSPKKEETKREVSNI